MPGVSKFGLPLPLGHEGLEKKQFRKTGEQITTNQEAQAAGALAKAGRCLWRDGLPAFGDTAHQLSIGRRSDNAKPKARS